MFEFLQSLFGVLVRTGAPLALFALGVVLAWRRAPSDQEGRVRLLTAAEAWCGLLWLVVLGEHWSGGRIRAFDYGSPLLSLATLVLWLPVVWFLYRRRDEVLAARGKGILLGVSVPLLVLSLVPGLYLVAYVVGMAS